MRDLIVFAVVFGVLPFVFKRPYIGIYLWAWMAFMNPHRMSWSFAYDFPFSDFIAAVTLIAILFSTEKKRILWTRETVLLLIFIMWMWFTTFFAYYEVLAWEQWDKVWKIQLMVYITLMLINTRQKLDWLIWVIVLSLGIYGVKGGIFTIANGGAYHVMGPPDSFIAGNNEIALAMTMTIPLMRYLQMQAKSLWIQYGLTVTMLLTGIAVIGSQSRGALLGITAMGAFLWLKSRKKMFIMVAILAVVGAVAAIMPQEWYDRMDTISTYEDDESAQGRINAWWMAYNLASNEITGGGFETFQRGVFRLYAPVPNDVHDSHSIIFEIMGEQGFIGLFFYLLLAWFTWNTGSRIRRKSRHSQETVWAGDLAGMVQVCLVGYAGCGLFLGLAYFDYYYTLIAITAICHFILNEQIACVDGEVEKRSLNTARKEPVHGTYLRPLVRK